MVMGKSFRNFAVVLDAAVADAVDRAIQQAGKKSANAYLKMLVEEDLRRRGLIQTEQKES
jgi:hypothetical protein